MGLDIKTLAAAKSYVKNILNSLNNFSGSYNDLKDKPDIYTKNEIYNKDEVDNALTGKRNSTEDIPWWEISGKPDEYPPSPHKHKDLDIDSISASKITGVLNLDQIPASAQERLIKVKDEDEMLGLTIDDVQNGDTVKVLDGDKLYHVVDDTKLDTMDGYIPFTSGAASFVYWDSVKDKPTLYNKDDVDSLLEGKRNVGDSYTKTETDTLLASKRNVLDSYTKAETYTKAEVGSLLSTKGVMNAVDITVGTDWTGTSAPYSQNVTVTGVTASSTVFVTTPPGITSAQFTALAQAAIIGGAQGVNYIQLIAHGKKPTVNIPLRFVVYKP